MLDRLVSCCKLSAAGEGGNAGGVSVWINNDIRPLPPNRRTWSTWTFIGWWSVWQLSVTNWQLGGALVANSLSVWQAMLAVIIGRVIAAVIAVLIGYIGAEWYIGYPVYSRVIWGVYGSFFVIVQRIGLSIVGLAFQSFTGGLCVTAVLSAMFPSFNQMQNTLPASANVTTKQIIGWALFNIMSIPLLYKRPERSARLISVMNLFSIAALMGIMIWALSRAHGAGELIHQSAQLHSSSALGFGIVQGVTTVVGTLSIALSSQMDFSRFARKPSDQVFGQWFAFIVVGTIMPLFGCLTSSATQSIYGEALWNPPTILSTLLLSNYSSATRAAVFFAGVGLTSSQLAVNVVDNGYSVGMDLAGLLPTYINIRRGCYVGLVISLALCPWQLLSTAATFVSVISSFSVFMTPICAIQVSDYWIVRHRRLKLSDLYHARQDGIYFYSMGVNVRSLLPWIVGWAPLLPGFLHSIKPDISVPVGAARLYSLAFPYGFLSAFAVNVLINKLAPPPGLGEIDPEDTFGAFVADEATSSGTSISALSRRGSLVLKS